MMLKISINHLVKSLKQLFNLEVNPKMLHESKKKEKRKTEMLKGDLNCTVSFCITAFKENLNHLKKKAK